VPWAIEAQKILAEDWGVAADVWSVTSWNELRRDGLEAEEQEFLDASAAPRVPFVTRQLLGTEGPVIAVSDYMKAVPDQIRQFVPGEYAVLGADGFGFSDTRQAARRFFKIDSHSVVVRALQLLAKRGQVDPDAPARAIEKYRLHDVSAGTTGSAGGDS
jgi:pyruvate dehydrogenase E1 component